MRKAFIAVAVATAFWSTGSMADQTAHNKDAVNLGQPVYTLQGFPTSAPESSFGMSTLTSLDTRTGGYKGWGPMPNPQTASSVDESMPIAMIDQEREHLQHLADVRSHRDQVWVANAPLRSEYENIGATRSQAGGSGGFFSR